MRDEQNHIDNDEISLKELIQKIQEWIAYLKTQWKLIIGIAALGAIIGVTIALIIKPNYKATMTFVLEEDKGGGMSGALGLASSFGIDIGAGSGGIFTNNNIIELMKSRHVVEKAILNPIFLKKDKNNLLNLFIGFNKYRNKYNWMKKDRYSNVTFPINIKRQDFTILQDTVLQVVYSDIIENNLIITQKDKKVSIITIEVKSKNEFFSKLFCEQLVKETSAFYIETKSKKARQNVDILQNQADSIRTELNNSISGVAAASDNVYNLNPAFNIKSTPSKRKQVDVQANTAILTQLVAQLELAKVNLRKETPLIQIIDEPSLPLKKEKLGRVLFFLLGGTIAGFSIIVFLIFRRVYKRVLYLS